MGAQEIDEEIDYKTLQAVNQVYEMTNDPEVFSKFAEKLAELIDEEQDAEGVYSALNTSAKLAERVQSTHEVDITRDIGILVLGINRNNKVCRAPPRGEKWLNAKFINNSNGIGWIDTRDNIRNIAHILQLDGQKHLPIHSVLQEGLKTGEVSTLVVVHQFSLSVAALNALKGLYDLTPTETQICKQIAEAKTLREAAAIRNVKVSTVRSHLKSVFSKTGVKSQTELIRILTQISAASAIQEFSQANKITLEPNWKNGLVSIQTEFCKTRYGTRLAFSTFGDAKGQPVLYFHHGLGSRLHFRHMAVAAKKHGLLIYKFDRPGFGHSDILPDMSTKAIGHIAEDLISHIRANKVSAIGYGLGGRIILDILPHINGRINKAVFYSFRGGFDNDNSTIMQKLSHVVWENPTILLNLFKIMKLNKSQASMTKNLRKYYADSPADLKVLEDKGFINDHLRKLEIAIRQDFSGVMSDHKNLKNPLPDFSAPAFDIPIKAIFGTNDPFNTPANNTLYLGHLPQCQILWSKGDGQLHIDYDFDRFLQSAYSSFGHCTWLEEFSEL